MGSKGDSYDNALAETINGIYKAEVIYRRSWPTRESVELARLEWVSWFIHHRLSGLSDTSRQQKLRQTTTGNSPVRPPWWRLKPTGSTKPGAVQSEAASENEESGLGEMRFSRPLASKIALKTNCEEHCRSARTDQRVDR